MMQELTLLKLVLGQVQSVQLVLSQVSEFHKLQLSMMQQQLRVNMAKQSLLMVESSILEILLKPLLLVEMQ